MKLTHIIGIDEVGRGPLAGPVAVGVFCVEKKLTRRLGTLFPGARDSKKLSSKRRDGLFEIIDAATSAESIRYSVQFESARIIDTKGLSWAIKSCITKGLNKVLKGIDIRPDEIKVLLDGGLRAPAEYIHQQTIIRGDDSEMIISLASIVAKVTRDRHMKKLAKKYPGYGFDIHKGYGTVRHRRVIQDQGLSPEHRRSFCKAFLQNIQK